MSRNFHPVSMCSSGTARLAGEVQQRARILSYRVEQHEFRELGRDLTQDIDRFRLESLKVRRKLFGQ
jgi:hypothetical protein